MAEESTLPDFEPICAPISAAGGAVALVRISGRGSWGIVRQVFSPLPREIEPKRAFYGRFRHGDDGLAVFWASGSGFTGEESAELSVHGSPASVRGLLESLIAAGARSARPGEFTERAFLHGRLDLAQAEGVRAGIEAATDAQDRLAAHLRDGDVSRQLAEVEDEVVGVLAAVEASTDFSEEVGELDVPSAVRRLDRAMRLLEAMVESGRRARPAWSGLRVALIGRPNAGKSSLLNALLRADRALVTPIPGTTRDTLEERLDAAGVPVLLIDTAGLREGGDEVERLGMERTILAADSADEVLHLVDGTVGLTDEDRAIAGRLMRPTRLIRTKADLPDSRPILEEDLAVSSASGQGLEDLVRPWKDQATDLPAVLPRHGPILEAALDSIREARATLERPVPTDLAAVDLHAALRRLGEVTGRTAAPDMLDRIFRDFCIGK
ncbi:MAG: tRNA uridine-5-carboxymethylaminomethyl(34) synthesis GTPase MnmE [Fimbriimonadaceae bacterium]|nr:tRNA uridine-5-carboxymethylaminomethyl(34) synthesis GTPase MnmE [Fimbriimonadaceae bacterium]